MAQQISEGRQLGDLVLGRDVVKKVNYLNQGGTLWIFRLPKELASVN
ncbi:MULTISPECIES: hypothetical protein [unclassified Ruegeria]|nr:MULTISPECIES: hypothetical protein [unclassified Ruegeria]